jgi:Fic family protein
MNGGDCIDTWGHDAGAHWRYELGKFVVPIAEVSYAQGLLLGRLLAVGIRLREETNLAVLSDEVVKSSASEGEKLDRESVRSSIAQRLGIDIAAATSFDRRAKGNCHLFVECHSLLRRPVDLQTFVSVARSAFSHRSQ